MLPELIEVFTTTAEKSDAETIASLLVEKRLAACTQVSGPLESRYRWNDRIETTQEWRVVAKTRGELYSAVEEAILAAHPYDEPEVLAIPIVAISAGYRTWLLDQLAVPENQPTGVTLRDAEATPAKPASSRPKRPRAAKKE